jgi:hypothetical protein
MSDLDKVFFGGIGSERKSSASETPQQLVEGVVRSVGAAGIIFVVDGQVHGPAPYLRGEHSVVGGVGVTGGGPVGLYAPAPGDRCLVAFLTNAIERPWVLGWWPSS